MRLILQVCGSLAACVIVAFSQQLTPVGKAGDCPLTHTSVKADISGMVARVEVV